MRKKIFIHSITMVTIMFFSCSIQEKNIDNKLLEDSHSAPLPEQTIDMNSVLAEGTIIQQNGNYYFLISKVIERGKQAPAVLQGQQLQLTPFFKEYACDGSNIKAILRCQQPKQSNSNWSIEIKN